MTQRWRALSFMVVPALLGHVVLPLSFFFKLWRAASHGLVEWLSMLYLATAYTAFLFLVGAWSWFGNGTRYALGALLVLAAVAGWPRAGGGAIARGPRPLELAARLGLGTACAAMTVLALRARGLYPARLERYAIYGAEVTSPCAGVAARG
jgi:hypothetical protein